MLKRLITILLVCAALSCPAFAVTQLPLLVGAGDSITNGGTPGSISYLNQIIPPGASWQIRNAGINGNTVAAMIGQGPTLDTNLIPDANNVLVVWAGTNDMGNVGDTPANTYANLVTYCHARQSAGWIVVVVQMMSRIGNNPVGGESMDADKTAYNALIDAGWPTFARAEVVLPAQVTANGAFANMTNFLDGIHPTVSGVTNFITPNIQTSISVFGGTGIIAIASTTFFGSQASASTFNLPSLNVAQHNLLVVAIRTAVAQVSAVHDPDGDTFVALVDHSSGPQGNFQFWYAKNCAANTAKVVTVDLVAAGVFNAAFLWNVSGADVNAPFDIETSNSSLAPQANTNILYPGTSFTNELFLVAATSYGVDETFGAGTGFTLDNAGFPSGAGNRYCGSQHITVGALQNNSTGNGFMFLSPNVGWGTALVAFKTGFTIGGGVKAVGPTRQAGPTVHD